MFSFCKSLYNFDELQYLNTENVMDFFIMFQHTKISNINSLKNWDSSNSESLELMFNGLSINYKYKTIKKFECFRI